MSRRTFGQISFEVLENCPECRYTPQTRQAAMCRCRALRFCPTCTLPVPVYKAPLAVSAQEPGALRIYVFEAEGKRGFLLDFDRKTRRCWIEWWSGIGLRGARRLFPMRNLVAFCREFGFSEEE